MLALFKCENKNRKALRKEYETVLASLMNSDDTVQMSVGAGINMANTFFMKSYPGGHREFQEMPMPERIAYIEKITAMETNLHDKMEARLGLGFALFKMWLGAVSAHDTKLMDQFSEGLEYFSKKGELMGMALMEAGMNADETS